jgi:tRNA threonylcarbamoyladenosine biosynthesis protein TsaB
VTTGEALIAALPPGAAPGGHAVWAAVDNRRGRVVIEIANPGAAQPDPPLVAPLTMLPVTAWPVLVLGDAAEAVATAVAAGGGRAEARPGLPDAVAVARVAARRLAGHVPPRDARPLYAEPPAVRPPA